MTTEFLRLPGGRREIEDDDVGGGGVRSLSLSLSPLTTTIGTPGAEFEFCRLRDGRGGGLAVEVEDIDIVDASLSRYGIDEADPLVAGGCSCRVVIGTVGGRRASKVLGDARPVSAECLSLFDGC